MSLVRGVALHVRGVALHVRVASWWNVNAGVVLFYVKGAALDVRGVAFGVKPNCVIGLSLIS